MPLVGVYQRSHHLRMNTGVVVAGQGFILYDQRCYFLSRNDNPMLPNSVNNMIHENAAVTVLPVV